MILRKLHLSMWNLTACRVLPKQDQTPYRTNTAVQRSQEYRLKAPLALPCYSRHQSASLGHWCRRSLPASRHTWRLRSWTNLSFDIPSSLYPSTNCTTIGSFLRLDIAHLVISVTTTTKNLLKMFLCLDERLPFVDKAASL